MNNKIFFALTILLLQSSFLVYSGEDNEREAKFSDTLNVDRIAIPVEDLAFPNDDDREPDKSEFKIVNQVFMSSESGERWATITIENLSSGQRFLESNHIMGITANGKRIHPTSFKHKFRSHEIRTIAISFGTSKFPLLSVYTNN